jgi:hypothetical protein
LKTNTTPKVGGSSLPPLLKMMQKRFKNPSFHRLFGKGLILYRYDKKLDPNLIYFLRFLGFLKIGPKMENFKKYTSLGQL